MEKISILELITNLLDENEKSISDVKGVQLKIFAWDGDASDNYNNLDFLFVDENECFVNQLKSTFIKGGMDHEEYGTDYDNDLSIYILLKDDNVIFSENNVVPRRINKNYIMNLFDSALEMEEEEELDINRITKITVECKNIIMEFSSYEELLNDKQLEATDYIQIDDLGNTFNMTVECDNTKYKLRISKHQDWWVQID